MYDIVTIGSTTRDAFMRTQLPVVDDAKIPGGKAMHVALGAKLEVEELTITPGGNSANAAVTFARQGFKPACFAEVGNDKAADEIEDALKGAGVTSLLRREQKNQTAFSAIFLAPSGERTIFTYHGANAIWEAPLPVESFTAPWWYVSLSGKTTEHFTALMDHARAQKIIVAFNPSGYHIRHHKNDIKKYLRDISFLVLNQEEAAELLDMDWKNEHEVFKRMDELVSPGIVAISYGPKGSAISDGKTFMKAGIFPEQTIADRTGAGDAFGSGFIAGLIQRGKPIEKIGADDLQYAMRLGSANATSVVEHVGATPGILTKEQLENDERWQGDISMKVENL